VFARWKRCPGLAATAQVALLARHSGELVVQSNDNHLIDAGAASHALSVLESRFASAQSKLNPSRRKLLRMILENP